MAAAVESPIAAASTSTNNNNTPTTPVFEFTKRKRWADLLVSELFETFFIVLSPAGTIWYCGSAVSDILGWKEDECVDAAISQFMTEEDATTFRQHFDDAVMSRTELFTYVRLKCKPGFVGSQGSQFPIRDVLIEIKGSPHFVPGDDDCKCFFGMAKPYPAVNCDALNSFLELRLENERLSQRLAALQSSVKSEPDSPTPRKPSMLLPPPIKSVAGPSSVIAQETALTESPTRSTFETGSAAGDDEDEDNKSKKRARKNPTESQHVCVTCGRTDSPEWRKGPMGPKTLCNACGLRWAKRTKKAGSEDAGGGTNDLVPGSPAGSDSGKGSSSMLGHLMN